MVKRISNYVCIAWIQYNGQPTPKASSITHQFPITFTTVYSIVGSSHTTTSDLHTGYFCAQSYTTSAVTYAYNINKFVIIIGEKT